MALLFYLLRSDSCLFAGFQPSFSHQGQLGTPRIFISTDRRISELPLSSVQQRHSEKGRRRIFFGRMVLRFARFIYSYALPLHPNNTWPSGAFVYDRLERVGTSCRA